MEKNEKIFVMFKLFLAQQGIFLKGKKEDEIKYAFITALNLDYNNNADIYYSKLVKENIKELEIYFAHNDKENI